MPTNRDFLKRLVAGKASFFLADFHVHSPASHDFRGTEKVDTTSSDILERLTDYGSIQGLNDKAKHEAIVLETQAPNLFYEAIVNQRNRLALEEGIQNGEDWAFVAITDHDVSKNAVRLAKYAWDSERLKQNRLVILPGIELSIEFPVPGTNSTAVVHLLLIFPPLTEAEQIYAVIRDSSKKSWEFGEELSVDNLPEFVSGIRHHIQYPAISIAAHVGSSKGVREEAKKCILSHLEAEITRAEGELQTLDLQDREALESRLVQFKEKQSNPDAVSFEVLQLIGMCGFDALQTRGTKDESYYRRLHRFRDGFGRSVSIVCSDAHKADSVFLFSESGISDPLVPYIKLSGVSSKIDPKILFGEIKDKALKFGETRTTQKSPKQVTSWIEGIEIIPDASDAAVFWPFVKDSEGRPTRFTIQFSRNLNCVIGGRGSGKSALIEILSFLCSPEDFNHKPHHQEDWYQRAAATLRGCRVRLCWRALDHSGKELPRRAFFMNRYFDGGHKHSAVTCQTLDEKEILAGTLSPPSIQVFRIHDIEKTAKPELLRSLFDTICGDEIKSLSKQIDEAVQGLTAHRSEMLDVAEQITSVTEEDGPLRQYARRQRDFDDVNKPEIQEQYQKIDEASAAEGIADSLDVSWSEVTTALDLDSHSERIREWFADSRSAVSITTDEDSQAADVESADDNANEPSDEACRPLCEPIASAIEVTEVNEDEETTADTRILKAIQNVGSECQKVSAAMTAAKTGLEAVHRKAREALANEGYPTGSAARQTKKTAFEEAGAALKSYRDLWAEWDRMADERIMYFKALEALCQRRTEIRKATAERITQSLATDLDPTILKITADAQPIADVRDLQTWLQENIRWNAQHKAKRFRELAKQISPLGLRNLLLTKNTPDASKLEIDKPSVADGRITSSDATTIIKNAAGMIQLEAELTEEDNQELFETLPEEVKNGLWTFPSDVNIVDAALQLDEVILDDLPEIRLNDRPSETDVLKPLEKLSPGQRCSAILPILLLNGTSPLVIDQPEDNLDNRLIRQVIVNVLSSIKLHRQVIVATHNPNLPVLGDAEQVIVLRAVEDEQCLLEAKGDLDQPSVVRSITEIMEGGREAFQYRHTIYREHWSGGAEIE